MQLWDFPDQYVVEPTDGHSGSVLAISCLDCSMKLIDDIPQCNSLRVPKIKTIYGVVGMLKLLAGLEAFTGRMEDFGFEDYLKDPRQSESIRPIDQHHGMEVRLGLSKGPPCPSFM